MFCQNPLISLVCCLFLKEVSLARALNPEVICACCNIFPFKFDMVWFSVLIHLPCFPLSDEHRKNFPFLDCWSDVDADRLALEPLNGDT